MSIHEFCEIYEYLASRLNNSPGYVLERNERNSKLIRSFLKNTKISTSDEAWKYLSFQMVLSDRKNSGKYYIGLSRCLGKNAIKQWNERGEEQLFLVSKFLRQRGLRNPLKKKRMYSSEYLDFLRHKFWNTPRGYLLCEEYNGMLYDKIECEKCRYKKACEV